MKYWLLVILFLFSSSVARGQAGQATEIKSGPTNPTTCNVARGWLFWNTTTSTMNQCTATNVWTAISTSAGSGITPVASLPATCTPGVTAPVQLTVSPFAIYTCTATNTWSSAGPGLGTGSGAEAIQGFTLSPNCPTTNTGQCFNSPANTQQAVDCSWTSGGTTVTCATSHFVAADVGKRVFGFTTCDAFNAAIASDAASGALSNSVSGSKLTISAQTGTGLTFTGGTAANTVSSNTHCLIWGTPDDAGAALLDTAAQAAPFCPKILLVAAYYMFTDPHFFTQPTACANGSSIHGAGTVVGNLFYAAGMEIEGRGQGATIIWLPPTFPENSLCNHGAGSACFVRTLEGAWSNFQITGGQNSKGVNNAVLIEIDGPGSTENFTCLNWGAGNSGAATTGMLVFAWERFQRVDNSGCGFNGITTSGSATGLQAFSLRVENSAVGLLVPNGGNVNCYDCGFYGNQYGAVNTTMKNTGGAAIFLYRSVVQGVATGTSGYLAATTAGSTLTLRDSTVGPNGAGNFTAVTCSANCFVEALQSHLTGAGSGTSYTDVAGSTFVDQGGNSIGGGVAPTVNAFVSQQLSVDNTALTTGNIGLTSGWGSSSVASVAPNSNSHQGRFTITGAAGSSGPTLTLTFPAAYVLLAPASCRMQFDSAGAFTDFTSVTAGTPTKTAVVFTFVGTSTAVSIVLDYECGP